jgi:peroxiredoxin
LQIHANIYFCALLKQKAVKILQIGDKAPAFTAVSTDRNMVSLSDFHGKNVLLLFFPFAFTGVCTKELCMMRDDISRYEGLNAEVIGISVDSPHALRKFKEEQNLPFLLLSDFNKTISSSYGCLYEEFPLGLKGVSKRSAFLIDKNGLIKYAEILENAGELPNFVLINQTLESLS